MATTAAVLDILVNANTTQATTQLRQVDRTVQRSAQTAKTATSSLTASYHKQIEALGSANASYRQAAQHMGVTAAEARKLAAANTHLAASEHAAAHGAHEHHHALMGLGTSLKGVGKAAVGAAAAYVGLGAAKSAISTTEDLAKATLTLHKNLGLSAKVAGGIAAEAKVRNVDSQKLTMSTKSYANAVTAAADGTSAQADSFRTLGISTKELKSLGPDKLLFAISDGAAKLGDGVERTKALGAIFGRSFGPLGPIFREGSAALKAFIADNTKAGANLGAQGGGLQGVTDLVATQRELKRQTQGLSVEFTKTFGPILIRSIKILIGYMEFMRKVWQGLGTDVKFVVGAIVDGFHWITKAGKNVVDWFSTAWANLGDILAAPFRKSVASITGFINDIIGVINTVLGPVGVHIGEVGGGQKPVKPVRGLPANVPPLAGGKPPKPGKKQGGFAGLVPGQGSGDKVLMQAMVEPSEGVFIMNKNAMGALEGFNKAVPRFAFGGKIPGLPGGSGPSLPDLPGVGGLPDWLKPAGEFVLAKVGGFIKDKLASVKPRFTLGGGGAGALGTDPIQMIIAAGHAIQKMGFQVSENPAFGGVSGVHAPGSYHYSGRAIDVNWANAAKEPAHLIPLYNMLAKTHPTELFYQNRGIPGPVPNHYDHLHLAYQKGGIMAPKHGTHWLGGLGSRITANQGATLLWQAGMSPGDAARLSTVLPDESGGSPTALNRSSGAQGLWQILGSVYPGDLNNPIINSINAAIKWRTQGPGAWPTYPGSGPRGHILRSAVMGGKTKVPKGKGKKKAKEVGGGGDDSGIQDMLDAAQAAIDIQNARIGSANELIGSGNLELLQRYQTGVAQNPLLGISSPGSPSLAASLALLPPASLADLFPPQANTIGSQGSSNFQVGQHGVKGGVTGRWKPHIHNHFYIDGKEIQGITKKEMRRASKRGRRGLPSARA